MIWTVLFVGLACLAFGVVFVAIGRNALAAAELRRLPEQHEHVNGAHQ
jgi:hypothetical protein